MFIKWRDLLLALFVNIMINFTQMLRSSGMARQCHPKLIKFALKGTGTRIKHDLPVETAFQLLRNPSDQSLEVVSPLFPTPFRIDFNTPAMQRRLSQANKELVTKAVSTSNKLVVDLTVGLGRDAVTLAAAGKHVFMFERNPTVHQLLQDAFLRLEAIHPELTKRLHMWPQPLDCTDVASTGTALQTMRSQSTTFQRPFAVYLDPMYPNDPALRGAKSRKETQILHLLTRETEPRYLSDSSLNNQRSHDHILHDNDIMENDDKDGVDGSVNDERQLFNTAAHLVSAGAQRIIVKRGRKDRPIHIDDRPNRCKGMESVMGSTQRFDVYLL